MDDELNTGDHYLIAEAIRDAVGVGDGEFLAVWNDLDLCATTLDRRDHISGELGANLVRELEAQGFEVRRATR